MAIVIDENGISVDGVLKIGIDTLVQLGTKAAQADLTTLDTKVNDLNIKNDTGVIKDLSGTILTTPIIGSTDYEEGLWTPQAENGVDLTQNTPAWYVKIGKMVTVGCDTTTAEGTNGIYNLPFTSAANYNTSFGVGYQNATDTDIAYGHMNGGQNRLVNFYTATNGSAPINDGSRIMITISYKIA